MRLGALILIRATEKQLRALGTGRKFNKGWLKRAMKTEFTKEQLEEFFLIESKRPIERFERYEEPKDNTEKNERRRARRTLRMGADIPYGAGSPEEYANAIYLEFRSEFEPVSLTTIPDKIWT